MQSLKDAMKHYTENDFKEHCATSEMDETRENSMSTITDNDEKPQNEDDVVTELQTIMDQY